MFLLTDKGFVNDLVLSFLPSVVFLVVFYSWDTLSNEYSERYCCEI
jgi:hypothetical protein